MLVDAAAHASGASKRLISPSYLCRQIFGHDGKNTQSKTGKQAKYKGQNQKKNNVQKTLSEINVVDFRRPLSNCLLCWVDHAVVRS